MKNKTTKIITVETWEKTTIRNRPAAIAGWCVMCQTERSLLTPDDFARLFDLNIREVYRRIENGAYHFIETTAGLLLICSGNEIEAIESPAPKNLRGENL